jgi:hypothetical protein
VGGGAAAYPSVRPSVHILMSHNEAGWFCQGQSPSSSVLRERPTSEQLQLTIVLPPPSRGDFFVKRPGKREKKGTSRAFRPAAAAPPRVASDWRVEGRQQKKSKKDLNNQCQRVSNSSVLGVKSSWTHWPVFSFFF